MITQTLKKPESIREKNAMLTATELVQILSKGKGVKSFGCGINQATVKPFELSARDFLSFAVEDLKIDSVHGKVNTLSNIKRAIDCRIEELLYCYCLHRKSKHHNWDIPKKLEILTEIGILAPRILRRISTLRNRLEHQFEKPCFEKVEDAVDVGQLFLEATEKLSYPITSLNKGANFWINFKRDKDEIELQDGSLKQTLKIGAEDDWLIIAKLLVTKRKDVMV